MKTLMIWAKMALCLALSAVMSMANAADAPKIKTYSFGDASMLCHLSDNGCWAVAYSNNQDAAGKLRIVDLNNETSEEVVINEANVGNAYDITDDGSRVAGSLNGVPAYYDRATKSWTTLPLPAGYTTGQVNALTADGHFAVGQAVGKINEYDSYGVMWDLTKNEIVPLTNVPTLDLAFETNNQVNFTDISADGRYIVARISYSYMWALGAFVYDVQEQKATYIGFDVDTINKKNTPLADNLWFIDNPVMSPNGKWITGDAYVVDNDTEFSAAFRYNVEANTIEVYSTDFTDQDMSGKAIDDNGNVYAATPTTSPLRTWSVRSGGYWYSLTQILRQKYNIDFTAKSGFDNTGTPLGVSADGLKFIVMVDPQEGSSYYFDTVEPIADICGDLNILGDYIITPADGSTFSKAKTFSVQFNRDIEFIGKATDITLTGADGSKSVANSGGTKVSASDSKSLTISFFPQPLLTEGVKYTLTIPRGTVCVKGDATKTNDVISTEYNGRVNEAVKMTSVYPEDGSRMQKIDYNGSPIIITFNSPIIKSDNASAKLEIVDGDNVTTVCSLNTAYQEGGNNLAVYPPSAQYLFLGNNYRVTVGAGTVTDIMGNGGNDEIVLNYIGEYERSVSTSDTEIFADDFSDWSNSFNKFLLYDGDHNTPASIPASMEFDADNTPWNFSIRESETALDYAAASHSMYSPSGKSDDWMMTQQLYIPDEYCKLIFDAQSYKFGCTDRLKVVIWESNDNVQYLNDETMAKVKAECVTVFDEALSPGATEEGLTGEWTKCVVDLAAYKEKNIHIAFVNENDNQSMVFVDNVQVLRNMKYLMSLSTDSKVVQKESVVVSGTLTNNSETDVFSTIRLTLKDGKGNKVDEIAETGLAMKKGDKYPFSFATPLPLVVGDINKYTIDVQLDDFCDVVKSEIRDLTFSPVKRVVLEEYTGMTCPNCPQGIIVIEKLCDAYGDQIIPISIHGYTGDPWGAGLESYYGALGLSAAPSAVINRTGSISYPMANDNATNTTLLSDGENLWMDRVAAEMEQEAEAEVALSIDNITEDGTFDLPISVRYALNAESLNLGVFTVIMEDGLVGFQQNTFSGNPDPALGDWGLGGKYGQSLVMNYVHEDVVRGYLGNVYGTTGYFPQTMEAGKTYTHTYKGLAMPEAINVRNNAKLAVMLIDGNTGKVVNAAVAKFRDYDETGIENVANDDFAVVMTLANGSVNITTQTDATAQLYTMSGVLISQAKGAGQISLGSSGYHGTAVVKVACGGKSVIKKIIL